MRQGYDPSLIFDKKGEIFAIGTGSDACAEHEVGSGSLQRMLCSEIIGAGSKGERSYIQALRDGVTASALFPDLLRQKTIDQNLNRIQFVEGVDERTKKPAALLWVSANSFQASVNHRELSLLRNSDMAGAWDENGFAFKVVGRRLVSKLKTFAQRLKEGEGCFAGLFLEDERKASLSGVVVALRTEFRPEHLVAVKKAQERYDADMLLKALSRVDELHELVRSRQEQAEKNGESFSHLRMPGYVWPIWKNGKPGFEVCYGLNPGPGVQAKYGGPYTFEQLAKWSLAEKKYPLKPL